MFKEKEKVLCTKFFPSPPDADLSNIENFEYPPQLLDKGQITVDEVRAAICCPKANKVPGITGIPYLILQKSLKITAEPITALFQACLTYEYHPAEFKQARTVVLRKVGNVRDYIQVGSY